MKILRTINSREYIAFVEEIKQKIRKSQYEALKAVNKELINLYWDIGRLIVKKQKELGWGKSVVENLAKDLQKEFSGIKGFSVRNIWYMRNFYMDYVQKQKLQPMVAEIGWTHNVIIMDRCKDDREREFYITMTKKFGWTKNVLIHHIESRTYEKTLAGQTNFDMTVPVKIRNQAKLAVKDEYTFDFLELGEEHMESELEHAGKMQFYLSVLNENVKLDGENPSIGIIICKSKNRTIVEYALKDVNKPIGVSTYKIKKVLPRKLSKYLPSSKELAKQVENVESGGSE